MDTAAPGRSGSSARGPRQGYRWLLNDPVDTDWVEWHRGYDSPTSPLSRRLEVVRRDLRRALGTSPSEPGGTRRLVSICAGDGRDVLPVIAEHDRRVRALLV